MVPDSAHSMASREAVDHSPAAFAYPANHLMSPADLTNSAVAASWLIPATDEPWRWEEDESAVVWSDGATVVFREELAQIVEHLAPTGLPNAGAVMLLLAATRHKIPPETALTERLRPILKGLRRIEALPPELISGVHGRALLVSHLLTGTPTRSSETARLVANVLRSGQPFSPRVRHVFASSLTTIRFQAICV